MEGEGMKGQRRRSKESEKGEEREVDSPVVEKISVLHNKKKMYSSDGCGLVG